MTVQPNLEMKVRASRKPGVADHSDALSLLHRFARVDLEITEVRVVGADTPPVIDDDHRARCRFLGVLGLGDEHDTRRRCGDRSTRRLNQIDAPVERLLAAEWMDPVSIGGRDPCAGQRTGEDDCCGRFGCVASGFDRRTIVLNVLG